MKIGFVGLGKLGFPCVVAMASKGHDVMGYDVVEKNMTQDARQYHETGPDGEQEFNEWMKDFSISFGSMQDVVNHSDIIFVAVQTPHDPKYEGVTRLPGSRIDFDYSYLITALRDLSKLIKETTTVVIISTVLPGTYVEELRPHMFPNKKVKICYNPFFIAMGTTVHDFLNPEFVLCGYEDNDSADLLQEFYLTIHNAPFCGMSIASAEATKVFYNTFISQKIVFANAVMEVCHKIKGCNVDDVQDALKLGKDRLISSAYMSGGMGDGGGCHPRDNIALSFLSRKLDLSHDIFEDVMMAREHQAEWLVDLMCEYDLPKAIVGYSFKKGSNITTGSPALLVAAILKERGINTVLTDPFISYDLIEGSHVILIGTKHTQFVNWTWPEGSVVIDPWRYIGDQPKVTVIRIGE